MSSYPLGQSEADTITSRTGKKLSQITLDEVKKGNVTADDIKISAETLIQLWMRIFSVLLSL